jgi:hypothetical protein
MQQNHLGLVVAFDLYCRITGFRPNFEPFRNFATPVAKLRKRNKRLKNIEYCHCGNWATSGCPIAQTQHQEAAMSDIKLGLIGCISFILANYCFCR